MYALPSLTVQYVNLHFCQAELIFIQLEELVYTSVEEDGHCVRRELVTIKYEQNKGIAEVPHILIDK